VCKYFISIKCEFVIVIFLSKLIENGAYVYLFIRTQGKAYSCNKKKKEVQ